MEGVMYELAGIFGALVLMLFVAALAFSVWTLDKEAVCERENNVYDCQIIAVPSPQVTD
jgi:hypothetical protein